MNVSEGSFLHKVAMARLERNELIKAALFIGLAMHFYEATARAHRGLVQTEAPAIFDVTNFGAKGDGKAVLDEDGNPENNFALMRAWNEACKTPGPAKVVIPPGNFVVSQVLFAGPCKCPNPVVEVQGTLTASTDLSLYPSPEWIMFERVDGVTLTGSGTFHAHGEVNWKSNDCKTNPDCVDLPASIKFHRVNNSVMENIKSVNSMFFHVFVTVCHNVTIRNVTLEAPDDSPNTDGIHTSRSDQVTITDSIIATGDDCVSVGQGSRNISVSGVTCGPGHGLSVGSLGKDADEMPVRFVHIKNCTLKGTDNGARVKTRVGKIVNEASDIVFEDLIMDHVRNPIIIDQQYGSKKKQVSYQPLTYTYTLLQKEKLCFLQPSGMQKLNSLIDYFLYLTKESVKAAAGLVSQVKVSNVAFRNIRGTSTTNTIVNLICSSKIPCEGIEVADIDLKPMPLKGVAQTQSACTNAKVKFGGKHDGLTCDGIAATSATEDAIAA
ncbi:hypothetical protein AKJ16_DCAP02395 [Drosera capensis]